MPLQETDLLLSWELVTGRRWVQQAAAAVSKGNSWSPELLLSMTCATPFSVVKLRRMIGDWWVYECEVCDVCTNQYRLLLLYWRQTFFSMYKFKVFIKLLYKYKTEVTDSLEVITGPEFLHPSMFHTSFQPNILFFSTVPFLLLI
jgi:hypothetical protein